MTPLKVIDELDAMRRVIVDELRSLDPGVLATRPEPENWSILEILEHIVIAEREVCRGMPDASILTPRRRTIRNRIMYVAVWCVMRFDISVRVPSRAMNPQGKMSIEEIGRDWQSGHSWIRSCVEKSGHELGDAIFEHPVCGPITLAQALQLDRLHTARHIRQARALLE